MRHPTRSDPSVRRRAPEPAAQREDPTPAEARETAPDKDAAVRPIITDWASL